MKELVARIADAVQKEGEYRCSGLVLVLDHRNLEDAIERALTSYDETTTIPRRVVAEDARAGSGTDAG